MNKIPFLALLTIAAPLPAVAEGLAGLKIGAELGGHRNKVAVTAPVDVTLEKTTTGFNARHFVGYDFELGDSFVLGGELGISRGGPDVKGNAGTAKFYLDPSLGIDVSARAGFKPSENLLLYGRVGLESVKYKISIENTAIDNSNTNTDDRDRGLLLGVGAEFAVSDNFGIRTEYRQSKHDDVKSRQLMAGAYFGF